MTTSALYICHISTDLSGPGDALPEEDEEGIVDEESMNYDESDADGCSDDGESSENARTTPRKKAKDSEKTR